MMISNSQLNTSSNSKENNDSSSSSEQRYYLPVDFVPTKTDILCGRGPSYNNHPGNKLFSAVVEKNLHKYRDASSKIEKSILLTCIVDEIYEKHNARFLKFDKKTRQWHELTPKEAHFKTGHKLRDTLLTMKRKMSNNKTTAQATKSQNSTRPCGNHHFAMMAVREKLLSDLHKGRTNNTMQGIVSDILADVLNTSHETAASSVLPPLPQEKTLMRHSSAPTTLREKAVMRRCVSGESSSEDNNQSNGDNDDFGVTGIARRTSCCQWSKKLNPAAVSSFYYTNQKYRRVFDLTNEYPENELDFSASSFFE